MPDLGTPAGVPNPHNAPFPGCVLRTTRGYRLPSLRDVRGEGGVARELSLALIPAGCLHAGGVGAGSPGCEATPGYAWERMNNPGGVEALP